MDINPAKKQKKERNVYKRTLILLLSGSLISTESICVCTFVSSRLSWVTKKKKVHNWQQRNKKFNHFSLLFKFYNSNSASRFGLNSEMMMFKKFLVKKLFKFHDDFFFFFFLHKSLLSTLFILLFYSLFDLLNKIFFWKAIFDSGFLLLSN